MTLKYEELVAQLKQQIGELTSVTPKLNAPKNKQPKEREEERHPSHTHPPLPDEPVNMYVNEASLHQLKPCSNDVWARNIQLEKLMVEAQAQLRTLEEESDIHRSKHLSHSDQIDQMRKEIEVYLHLHLTANTFSRKMRNCFN